MYAYHRGARAPFARRKTALLASSQTRSLLTSCQAWTLWKAKINEIKPIALLFVEHSCRVLPNIIQHSFGGEVSASLLFRTYVV